MAKRNRDIYTENFTAVKRAVDVPRMMTAHGHHKTYNYTSSRLRSAVRKASAIFQYPTLIKAAIKNATVKLALAVETDFGIN